jgi:hypothetical protein
VAGRRKVLSRSWPALTEELIGHYAAVLGRRRMAAAPRLGPRAVPAQADEPGTSGAQTRR